MTDSETFSIVQGRETDLLKFRTKNKIHSNFRNENNILAQKIIMMMVDLYHSF